ncbi:hypothetical protein B0H67DRAFT_359115 [Lasiosphaeris hirsuta]|uniref:DUF7514 domain-containing protein n=1 Tax=Lasiosphaeris hirsuta TaxID=260670 RepID=A0AA40DIG4_9PEZI|nr:hypothetical protein B0H67DRAFT_359115 [Lasiosphaeris hirsuta]
MDPQRPPGWASATPAQQQQYIQQYQYQQYQQYQQQQQQQQQQAQQNHQQHDQASPQQQGQPQQQQQPQQAQQYQQTQQPQQQQQQQGQYFWTPLFEPDGTPEDIFEALMKAFFSVLDQQNTGYMAPEVLSSFLDVQGFRLNDNIWKSNHRQMPPPFHPVDNADFELKAAYEAWYFEHRVVSRAPDRPLLPGGGMPHLTPAGFTSYMAVESAGDPELAFRGINAALRAYGVWAEMGPLPREMLPAMMPPQIKARMDQAALRSRAAAEQRIASQQAYEQMAAEGRRGPQDLAADPRYAHRRY